MSINNEVFARIALILGWSLIFISTTYLRGICESKHFYLRSNFTRHKFRELLLSHRTIVK